MGRYRAQFCLLKWTKFHKYVKISQGDNVTEANKQSKSSSIENIEIVDASSASKAVRVKPKAVVRAEKNVKRQFQDSWISDFPPWNTSQGLMMKGLTWRNMTQQKISKLGFPEIGKYQN